MSEKEKHDPEDRSSSEWLDKEYKGRFLDPSDRILDNPDWVRPDEVEPDDDGNITVTIQGQSVERKMPEAPRGVVVHLVNGESRVTEVVWVGTGLTGVEMWEVTARFQYEDIKSITIEFLPDNAQVHIGGSGGPPAEG